MKRTSLKTLSALAVLLTGLLVTTSASAYQFIYDCGAVWPNLPVTWKLNQDGSDDLSFATVETAASTSFQTWGDPCCSNWQTTYGGTTTEVASYQAQSTVLSFEENSWNPQFGSVNSTIGVTMTRALSNCTIQNAPILFNGVGFTFRDNGSSTDFQSIATHEIGHLLGLGHTSVFDATMYASYKGGTTGRALHQDDADGVCALYNRSCTCSGNNDCNDGETCVSGKCEDVPCSSNQDCDPGLECDQASGDCIVPPCSSDADCGDGFKCNANQDCVPKCAACRSCQSDSECGASNAFCVQGTCLVLCGQDGLCPGDSECWGINGRDGSTYYICGSPDAQSEGLCPSSYTCQESDDMPTDECTDDGDCASGEECVQTSNGKVCDTAPTDPCDGVTCDSGQVCENGTCVDDGTNNGGTNNGGTNNGGTNDECTTTADCPDGEQCFVTNDGRKCQPKGDACQDVTCADTEVCIDGSCVDQGLGGANNGGGGGPGGNDEVVIIYDDENKTTTDDSCSTTPVTPTKTGWLFALIGLGFVLRRRRNR